MNMLAFFPLGVVGPWQVVIIALVISGAGLIVFIMLHSGKGTGVSDMIQSSFYGSQGGTSIVEKNLDRITIVLAIIFFLHGFVIESIFRFS